MSAANSKTILFITGAFVHNSCWDEWKIFYGNLGYTTLSPPWPNKEATAVELRKRHPDRQIASARLAELVSHYEKIAASLPEKPIVIGHSIGGLLAQVLNQKGLAAVAVAIHSVPPQGIFTFKLSFLIAGWGPLGLFTDTKKTFLMDFKQWQYAFANGLPQDVQQTGYDRFVVPESKLIVRDTTTSAAKIDFDRPHNPLLLIAGSADHTIPASLNRSNFKRYKHQNSITDFKEFEFRNHFVLGQPGWQEIALYIQKWLEKIKTIESINTN